MLQSLSQKYYDITLIVNMNWLATVAPKYSKFARFDILTWVLLKALQSSAMWCCVRGMWLLSFQRIHTAPSKLHPENDCAMTLTNVSNYTFEHEVSHHRRLWNLILNTSIWLFLLFRSLNVFLLWAFERWRRGLLGRPFISLELSSAGLLGLKGVVDVSPKHLYIYYCTTGRYIAIYMRCW
jgi:hypothetical protein